MNNTFTIISYNIWFEDTLFLERTISLVKIINNINPDAICLQEVRPHIYKILLTTLVNYKYHFPKKCDKKYNCVIFSKYPIKKCLDYEYENSNMGRSLQIAKIDYPYHSSTEDGVSVEKVEIVVANTHFESVFKKKCLNETKIEQFRIAGEVLDTLYNTFKNVVFCADTNVLYHEEGKFNEYFDKWIDSWKEKGSHLSQYTYDSDNNIYLQNRFINVKYKSRIDRILFKTDNLILEEFNMLKGGGTMVEPSDHFGICSRYLIIKEEEKL